MAFNLGSAFVRVRAELDQKQVNAAAAQVGTEAGKSAQSAFGRSFNAGAVAQNFLKIGGLVTAGLAAGLTQLDTSARQYQATVGASAVETERAKSAALALFKVNTAGFDEILGLMAKLRTDQGLTEEQTNRLAQSYLTWAKVAGGTAADAAKSFDDVLDAFGLTAEDAAGIMDKLVASNQKFGGSLNQRVSDLARLAPALQGLGLDLGDAIQLENAFESAGVDAGAAQRALQTAISKLKPGENFQDLISQFANIEDNTARAQKAVELFGPAGAKLAQVFHPGTAELALFGVTATEAADKLTAAGAAIDSSIPKQFELFLKNIGGTLMQLAAPAGPVLLMVASLAQLTAGLAGPLLGSLKAVTGATTALGAAMALLPWAIVAAGVASVVVKLGDFTTSMDALQNDEMTRLQAGLKILTSEFGVNGQTVGQLGDRYRDIQKRLAELSHETDKNTNVNKTAIPTFRAWTTALGPLGVAMAYQKVVTDKATGAADVLNRTMKTAIPTYRQWTGALGPLGTSLALVSAGLGANLTAVKSNSGFVKSVLPTYRQYTAELLRLAAAAATANAQLHQGIQRSSVTGHLGTGGTSDSRGPRGAQDESLLIPDVKVPAVGGGGGGGGKSKAQQDAETLAATLKGKVGDALDVLKAKSQSAMDTLHAGHVKAIAETLELARTNHRAATDRIADALAVQRALNAAPVLEAEKAQQAIEDAHRLRDLNEAVAAAAAGGDANAQRSAQEALQSFQARAAIDALKATQEVNDKVAIEQARQATIVEDAKLAAAEVAAQEAADAEDVRFTAQKARFDAAYKVLQDDAKISGADIVRAVAAGMLEGIPEVEKAAAAVAAAVAKYLKTQSPAEAGPLHDMSPKEMGQKVAGGFIDAIKGVVRTADLSDVLKPLTDQFANLNVGKFLEPITKGMTGPASIASGLTVPTPNFSGPNDPHLAGLRQLEQSRQPVTAGGNTVNVYNPAPEPAGRSITNTLKLRSAFGS